MIIIKEGNNNYCLLKIMAMTGEFPTKAVKLLGDYNRWRRRIMEMTKMQTYHNSETGEKYKCVALYITGEKSDKSIRLTKNAMRLLEWIGLREIYERDFPKFYGNERAEKTHRNAEAMLMFFLNDVKVQKTGNIDKNSFPVFYAAKFEGKAMKNCNNTITLPDKTKKTVFTRVIGIFMNETNCMAVYNTRSKNMKWSMSAEEKSRAVYDEIARKHCKNNAFDSALIFGSDYATCFNTIMNPTSGKIKNHRSDFLQIYRKIYTVPLDNFGKKLMKIMMMPDFQSKLEAILMPEKNRRKGYGLFEYDGIMNGQYVFSFLDSNVARLHSFRLAMEIYFKKNPEKYGIPKIVCYYEQEDFVRKLFAGYNLEITRINIDTVLKKLGA